MVDYDQNHNIGWYYGRLSKKQAKVFVKEFIRRSFAINVRVEDIEIVNYAEANKLFSELKNR